MTAKKFAVRGTSERPLGGRKFLPATVRRVHSILLAACFLLALSLGAKADMAAGREAFARGEFDRAEAEWSDAARAGDPEAEFGLGEIYEQGRSDYRQAEYWYTRASEHGSIQAKYRLALIALAGNKDAPPDPVKAYKWAILASEAPDAWGRLAADLLQLLTNHLTAAEQSAGREQARAWGKQAVPRPPDGPENALAELNEAIRQIDCAMLQSSILQGILVVSGTVPDEPARARLVELATRLAPNGNPEIRVAVMAPPLCRSLLKFDAMRASGVVSDRGIEARLAGANQRLHEGDPIQVELHGASFPVNLRIDYFSLDGQVLHMWPNRWEQSATLDAAATRVFGDSGGKIWNAGGAPFGTEFIAVTATRQPLRLGASRPEVENGIEYLRDLENALRRARIGSAEPDLVAILLVQTGPRKLE